MGLSPTEIDQVAARLHSAQLDVLATFKITDEYPDLSMADAYAIQRALRALKLRRGAVVVGAKMGLTSRAKMAQMGISDPIHGFLVDSSEVEDGGGIALGDLIHPKVEAEIAFRLRRPLSGPHCSVAAVVDATDVVLPALEIIDSRYRDFHFDLPSVIADNTSAAAFVLGPPTPLRSELDLAALRVTLSKGRGVLAAGCGEDVLGHPALSVATLANMLAEAGDEIPAGAIILSGAATVAVPAFSGDLITAHWGELGSVSVRFTN